MKSSQILLLISEIQLNPVLQALSYAGTLLNTRDTCLSHGPIHFPNGALLSTGLYLFLEYFLISGVKI